MINKLLAVIGLLLVLVSSTAFAGALEPGAKAPEFSFVDIENREGSTGDYKDRVRVYTFANRDSSSRLIKLMSGAAVTTMVEYPALKTVYFNFADVSSVPRFARGIARPLIRFMARRTAKIQYAAYEKEGIARNDDRLIPYMIPDWAGAYKSMLGIENGDRYHIWLARNGVIQFHYEEGVDQVEREFMLAMKHYALQLSEAVIGVP